MSKLHVNPKSLRVLLCSFFILVGLSTTVSAITLDTVNKIDQKGFVKEFGEIFEHSPWVAQKAWNARPFASSKAVHQAMFDVLLQAASDKQIEFLNNHPELSGKEAQAGTMTASSVSEQKSAGLNSLNKNELDYLTEMNAKYQKKHGFPFMIFVRGHTKEGIFFYLERRLNNNTSTELKNSLTQVFGITASRINDKFSTD